MAKDPNLLIVMGDEAFLRRRLVRDVSGAKASEGWRVEEVDGSVEGAVETALDGGGGMFMAESAPTLVVVLHPEKVEPEVYKAHQADTASKTTLLLHYEGTPAGNTKFGKFVTAQKKDIIKECKAPKEWEAPALGAAFLLREAKSRGLTMDTPLAEVLVERAGSDLGVLSFEMLKLATLAEADGTQKITVDMVSQSLATLLEAEIQPVVQALVDRNVKRLCLTLDRVNRTSKTDATVVVCRVLSSTVLRWISVADLRQRGKSPEEAAGLLSQNPWYYKNKLLPQVNQWSTSELIRLLQVLATSERAVLTGAVNPWVGLVSRLAGAC